LFLLGFLPKRTRSRSSVCIVIWQVEYDPICQPIYRNPDVELAELIRQ
jgi:hypothetical protein